MNAISFCLFGNGKRYTQGASENVKLARKIYPEWDVVFHIEKGHSLTAYLKNHGVIVVEHASEPGRAGAFWRFETLSWKKRYVRVVCRDVDSRINVREKAAVDEWIAAGTSLHTMKEFPGSVPRKIRAGMFGVITADIPNFPALLGSWKQRAKYRDDENFLDAKLWPVLKHSHTAHRHTPSKGESPFPQHEPFEGRVGERVYAKVEE